MVQITSKRRRRNWRISISPLKIIYGIFLFVLILLFVLVAMIFLEDPEHHRNPDDFISKLYGGEGDAILADHHVGVHDHGKKDEKDIQLFRRYDFEVRDLPEHCSELYGSDKGKKWKEIIIKGERHSGTNWIRSILEANVENEIEVNQTSLDNGWKHGFLPPEGWGKPIAENEMLLVVTRDVFTWLPKMHLESYDPGTNKQTRRLRSFTDFLHKGKYTARCHPMPDKKRTINDLSKYQMKFCSSKASEQGHSNNGFWHNFFGEKLGLGGQLEPKKIIAERAENFIQIRTMKYKQWLSDDPSPMTFEGSKDDFVKNRRIHIPLESLTLVNEHGYAYALDMQNDIGVTTQETAVGQKLQNSCVPIYKSFHDVIERTKWPGYKTKRWAGKKFNSRREKQKLLKRYSKEDLRFILSQLDLEFEKKLGYTYDYVYEMLEQDGVPEKPRQRRHHRKRHVKS